MFLIVANSFLFAASLVEFVNYFNFQSEFHAEIAKTPALESLYEKSQSHAKAALLIGIFAFFFGILLPTVVFYKLNLLIQEIRKKTEKQFISWLNWWVKNYGNIKVDSKSPFYNRPDFWLNVALFTLETYGTNSRNPAINYLADLAPIIRSEISKSDEPDEKAG
ncbi:MAG: hypothetical protein A4S09_01375 [Proteobacteria bacterium SG_bin7]|nr:MAG: hypothetical protein A4S09_01375 [Proteobacteria bacterium SG_bin7]